LRPDSFAALYIGRELGSVDAIRKNRTLAGRNSLQAHKAVGGGPAHGSSVAAESVCEPVGQHARPGAFIDVVNGGDKRQRGTAQIQQPGRHVGWIGVAVNQLRLEDAEKAARLHETAEKADRILAYIEADGIEGG